MYVHFFGPVELLSTAWNTLSLVAIFFFLIFCEYMFFVSATSAHEEILVGWRAKE